MSTLPKILQDVRKRDNKARTFAPSDNNDGLDKIKDLATETLALTELTNLKKIKHFEKTTDVYDRINLNYVNGLINEIEYNVNEGNNIVDLGDNKSIYFRDLHNFLYDIKDNKINNFNKKGQYEKRIMNIENKLKNRKIKSNTYIDLYIKYLNNFKKILFSDKKSSGKGLNISYLPIHLSELNINSSKELMNNIKQLINNLCDNKQITKQVYNNLIKAITYKNDS